jgi:hypothetical protein
MLHKVFNIPLQSFSIACIKVLRYDKFWPWSLDIRKFSLKVSESFQTWIQSFHSWSLVCDDGIDHVNY